MLTYIFTYNKSRQEHMHVDKYVTVNVYCLQTNMEIIINDESKGKTK